MIIGVDFHPAFQPIASVDPETGECQEKRVAHREEAEKFMKLIRHGTTSLMSATSCSWLTGVNSDYTNYPEWPYTRRLLTLVTPSRDRQESPHCRAYRELFPVALQR